MKLDDIRTFLVSNAGPYCVALGLAAPSSAAYIVREMPVPTLATTIFIDDAAEEVEEVAPNFSIIALPLTVYVFCQGGTEATLRDNARLYAQAMTSCLRTYSEFMELTTREYFDGFEGKPDIKAAKVALTIKYEEVSA